MAGVNSKRLLRRKRNADDHDETKVHKNSKVGWIMRLRRLVIKFRATSLDRCIGFVAVALSALLIVISMLSSYMDSSYAGRNDRRGESYSSLRSRSRSVDSPHKNFVPREISPSGVSDMYDFGYRPRPRSIGYYFTHESELIGAQRLEPDLQRRYKERTVYTRRGAMRALVLLEDSSEYESRWPDPFIEGDCREQYSWQLATFPACNQIFEFDLTDLGASRKRDERVRIVNNGYWRDVWLVREFDGSKRAFKTIRYEHDFELRNYDRHRKDALASERLTSSPNIVDIFAFCGNSGVFEFGDGGDVDNAIFPHEGRSKLTTHEKLEIAVQIATSIADVHNFDKEGEASVAHTDITPGQFILVGGEYKLNDFNRARLIRWNHNKNEPCGFHVGNNPGKFRSPEEYSYELETEKVDVYSMGNIFYALLTELWPFEDTKTKKAQEMIMRGERPLVDENLRSSDDSAVQIIIKAMEMSWVHNPRERATAREVEQYLKSEVEKLKKSI